MIILYMEHADISWINSGSLCCVVCLSEPPLSVGPDSPSARATNLRRSSVTKLVLKLMRRVNILRQAVCIRPLTGFMFSCNLCLVSLGNSLGPAADICWFMVEGVSLGARTWLSLFLSVWEGDRDTNQMWRHFLEADKIWCGTVADSLTLPDPFGNSSSDT